MRGYALIDIPVKDLSRRGRADERFNSVGQSQEKVKNNGSYTFRFYSHPAVFWEFTQRKIFEQTELVDNEATWERSVNGRRWLARYIISQL